MPYARKDLLTWQKGMYYHIYNRGMSKAPLFREETNFLFTIRKIKEYRQAHHLSRMAYCLLPNHYHFLTRQEGDESAGNLPQAVFNSYTKAYNKKYGHSGTLCEGRFHAKVVQPPSHVLHWWRSSHGTPVKDGFVADPAAWPYSNYLDWIGERDGKLVDRDFIKHHFGSAEAYKQFLFDYLQSRQLPDVVKKFIADLEK